MKADSPNHTNSHVTLAGSPFVSRDIQRNAFLQYLNDELFVEESFVGFHTSLSVRMPAFGPAQNIQRACFF